MVIPLTFASSSSSLSLALDMTNILLLLLLLLLLLNVQRKTARTREWTTTADSHTRKDEFNRFTTTK
jgi:hypothetical protein